MDEIEIMIRGHELAGRFPRGKIGDQLAEQARALWNCCETDSQREEAERVCAAAANYAAHVFREGVYPRSGSLEEWFGLPSVGLHELARRQSVLAAEWMAAPYDEEAEAAREREDERIDELEERGAYGRTHRYSPESEDWLFIRFGGLPREGKSRFGLMREDTEDGPDPWRQELGGMTHEAGVSVFRAYRHPDVPDAYVLLEPDFSMARYGVGGQRSHLLAVIPDKDHIGEIEAFLVSGKLATIRAQDGTLRVELGSDGEYLIDGRSASADPIPLSAVWASASQSVEDLLIKARKYGEDGRAPLV